MAANDQLPPVEYYHRKNVDGTVDAICPCCFLTAGTGTTFEELSKKELEHSNNCFKKCPASISFVREEFRKHK